MIKFSKSTMHEQNVLMFFRGISIAKNRQYMYEESLPLFAEGNLAPNLIEYDFSSEGALDLISNPAIRKIVDTLKASSSRKLSIVDVRLSEENMDSDLALEYSDVVFDWISIETLKGPLVDLGHFKVDFRKIESTDTGNIQGVDAQEVSYIRAIISKNFLRDRQAQLSEHLIVHFNPEWYVDTQIVFFLLMTALSGIAGAEEKRKASKS